MSKPKNKLAYKGVEGTQAEFPVLNNQVPMELAYVIVRDREGWNYYKALLPQVLVREHEVEGSYKGPHDLRMTIALVARELEQRGYKEGK